MQVEIPSQRNELYKNALFLFELNSGIIGFCYLFKQFEIFDLSELPEIYKHKPKPDNVASLLSPTLNLGYWFEFDDNGKQKRINILKQAIKETEK